MSIFTPGDVVVLKSGGPRMTVMRCLLAEEAVAQPGVSCCWFVTNYSSEVSILHFYESMVKLAACGSGNS
jgi:uncharacterized protein YodC (DUF2158 family)